MYTDDGQIMAKRRSLTGLLVDPKQVRVLDTGMSSTKSSIFMLEEKPARPAAAQHARDVILALRCASRPYFWIQLGGRGW